MGVDINRNFGVDFGQVEKTGIQTLAQYENMPPKVTDPCDYDYPGKEAFSEPETKAFRDFLIKNKDDLSFIINMHSYGNYFIYPFNGRDENDIEERRPGILNIFNQISKEAPFPEGTVKGNAKAVIGNTIGGDQDDWTLAELGIPSVTAEIGRE